MKERRYVSAPKLPQSEGEAVETEGLQILNSSEGAPSLLQQMIAEHYELENGASSLKPGAESKTNDYTYIDEKELGAPNSYEYIDEDEQARLLKDTSVSHNARLLVLSA